MNYSEFIKKYAAHPNYKAPKGNQLHAKSWQTEAPLRMLLNNLDQHVAEDPANLIVYGGTGQAARNEDAVKKIIRGRTFDNGITCSSEQSAIVPAEDYEEILEEWIAFSNAKKVFDQIRYLDRDGNETFEGLMDAMITVLIAMHDLKREGGNSVTGSVSR